MKQRVEISVVLGSLNRLHYLKATINTIRSELSKTDASEIIVVDGGSSDGSVEWLIRQKDIILILQHNHGTWLGRKIEKQSWGYYMNLAFKAAHYQYVLMISDDCLLIENSIINGINQIHSILESGEKIGGLAFLWRHWPDWEQYGVAFFYNKAHLNHGIYLKEALEAVGYADEESYSFYAADVDLSFKLHHAGMPIIMASNSFLEHYNHVSKDYKDNNYSKRDQEEAVLVQKWSAIWGADYFKENTRWRREVVDFIDKQETYKLFQTIQKRQRPFISRLFSRKNR